MRTYPLYFLDQENVGRFGFDADDDYRVYLFHDRIVGPLDFQADDPDEQGKSPKFRSTRPTAASVADLGRGHVSRE